MHVPGVGGSWSNGGLHRAIVTHASGQEGSERDPSRAILPQHDQRSREGDSGSPAFAPAPAFAAIPSCTHMASDPGQS